MKRHREFDFKLLQLISGASSKRGGFRRSDFKQ